MDLLKLNELINSSSRRDGYTIALEVLYNNYCHLKKEVDVAHYTFEKKYHDLSLTLEKNYLDIDLIRDIYFRFKINGSAFTFMLDSISHEDLVEIINDLFNGKYEVKIYSDKETEKIIETELLWTNNSLKAYNQKLKNYIPIPFFRREQGNKIEIVDGIKLVTVTYSK